MRKWLIKHAMNNVWAKPNVDAQMVCELVRMSPNYHNRVLFNMGGEVIWLPTSTDNYAVYDLGTFHPIKGLLNIDFHEHWVSLETLVNRTKASFLFYNLDGISLPSKYVYFKKLISDHIIVCIKADSRFFKLQDHTVYCKLYDHFALKNEPAGSYDGVRIETYEITNVYESNNVVQRYDMLLSDNQHTMMWVDGKIVNNPSVSDLPVGCYVEIVSDDTIYKSIRFNVGDLTSFTSELDKVKKYLLHLPKDGEFQYHDDVELYVMNGKTGRYYHRHTRAALTQLTHGDFAVSTKNVEDFAISFDNWEDVELQLVVRRPGLNVPLIYNNNRIHELYRLNDDQIISVLTGINSHLPFWKASELERSSINYLRSSTPGNITHKLTSDSYGYNAAIFYSADTPSKVAVDGAGYKVATLPPLLNHDSTCYEYDSEGKLLGWWYHQGGEYICRRNSTVLVEAVPGAGGKELDIVYGADDVLLKRYVNYRFYLQRIRSDGQPLEEYTDVTGTDVYYVDDNFIVKWNYDTDRYRSVVLSDKNHLMVKENVREEDGLIRVGVKHLLHGGSYVPVAFKFATVEVWLNGRPLVHGIDYIVDWPAVTITNKLYLIPGSSQEVIIRGRMPAAEINHPKTGFVIGGLLSDNSRYDIKDDKVVRIVYGGGIHHRDEVSFREDNTVTIPSEYNGKPFSIDSVAVPADNLLEGSYAQRRIEALERDELIEDFLSIHYPVPPLTPEQPLSERYPLYSPIMNKIILDHEAGRLSIKDDDEVFKISTLQLDEIMERYDYLLQTDPAYLGVNEWFVEIGPHWGFNNKEVPALLYTLLERINHRYFRARVKLSHHLTIRNDK